MAAETEKWKTAQRKGMQKETGDKLLVRPAIHKYQGNKTTKDGTMGGERERETEKERETGRESNVYIYRAMSRKKSRKGTGKFCKPAVIHTKDITASHSYTLCSGD